LYPQDIDATLAKQFGLNQAGGAVVTQVSPNDPAAKAGIRAGDVILKINGQTINSANDLRLRVSQTAPGSVVKLTIQRDGKVQDVDVTLKEFPAEETAENSTSTPQTESTSGGLKGVQVQALTSDLSSRLKLPAGTGGVLVTSVDPDSPAAAAELDRGCIIQEVNHKPVTSIESYRQAITAAGNQPVLLLVYFPDRGGPAYIVVQPE
jgi:serine protease Do